MVSPNKYKLISDAYWQDKKLIVAAPWADEDQQKMRQFRALEIVENDKYEIAEQDGFLECKFVDRKTRVFLTPEAVGCTCMDFILRSRVCKHIYAAAYLGGDKDAIAHSLSIKPRSTPIREVEDRKEKVALPAKDRKWSKKTRPQDIEIGKYFLLSDFLYSTSVAVVGVRNNVPDYDGYEVRCLRQLAASILDPVVEQFGIVSITYGYVSSELHPIAYNRGYPLGVHNCVPAKELGATMAAAADIYVHSMRSRPRDVLNWIRDNCTYDRLILYPNSPIICTAWADKPRYHCKEWVFPDSFAKAIYINARRDESSQLPLDLDLPSLP